MKLITGIELLESKKLTSTHSVIDRFKLFYDNILLDNVEDLKYLFYCFESKKVFYW
jgi:hypothetical protein